MKSFWKIVWCSFRQQSTYRLAMWAGLTTNLFFGLLRAAVLIALYGDQTSVNGLSLPGALTYVAISQAMISFLDVFGTTELMQTVYTGAIGADLLRPYPLFWMWMARDLGRALMNFVTRGVVFMAAFSLFYPVQLPSGAGDWGGLLLALALGWLVSFTWRFLVNLASLWTPDARGFARLAFTASQLFSGFFMPLRLYPDWFAAVCRATPFPALFNTSTEVYLGLASGPHLAELLLNQALWVIVLAGLCWLVLRLGVKRLVVQGG